jgi:hypothetical protein
MVTSTDLETWDFLSVDLPSSRSRTLWGLADGPDGLFATGISSTALAATPNDCAGGYALAVAMANTALQEDLQACAALPDADESGCVQEATAEHQAALEEAQANLEACMATAVPPTP